MPVFSHRVILGGGKCPIGGGAAACTAVCAGADGGVCARAGVANRANAETAVKNTFMILAR
jgi:hypothetical protein